MILKKIKKYNFEKIKSIILKKYKIVKYNFEKN